MGKRDIDQYGEALLRASAGALYDGHFLRGNVREVGNNLLVTIAFKPTPELMKLRRPSLVATVAKRIVDAKAEGIYEARCACGDLTQSDGTVSRAFCLLQKQGKAKKDGTKWKLV